MAAVLKRANLPRTIFYNKQEYKYLSSAEFLSTEDKIRLQTEKHVFVHVLSSNLKGKTDLHGRQYTPSRFVFILIQSPCSDIG